MENGLRAVCSTWITKIQKAWDHKHKQFGEDAEEAMRFFEGPYDWLYSGRYRKGFALGDEDDEARRAGMGHDREHGRHWRRLMIFPSTATR